MKQVAIIADDLSSATDCGIQMARSGLHTFVVLEEYTGLNHATTVDVVSLDTDSRSVKPEVAYERVKNITQILYEDGFRAFYKSMDSTLRGNLGAEVDAILQNANFDLAVIAPAFPHYGRTTQHGQHFLNNVPINQTEFAKDPQNPVLENNLVKIFSAQSIHNIGLIPLETLHAGDNAVAEQLSALQSKGKKLIIFDAVEEADLDRVVQSVSRSQISTLWVGSTGLARCIPSILKPSAQPPFHPTDQLRDDPVLFVIGSVSELTQKQLKECFTQQKVAPVPLNPFNIIKGNPQSEMEISHCYENLAKIIKSGKNAALYLASDRAAVPEVQRIGQARGLGKEEVALQLVNTLGKMTRRILDQLEISGLIISGGDTAKAVCHQLQATGIEILAEVEPGIPLCRLTGPYPVPMVTKAGAFGTQQIMPNAIDIIKRTG